MEKLKWCKPVQRVPELLYSDQLNTEPLTGVLNKWDQDLEAFMEELRTKHNPSSGYQDAEVAQSNQKA